MLGCFLIGFYGTATLYGSRFAETANLRLFVMVGICGGFTTFSSFSLETFELLRAGSLGRAFANVAFSVTLCLFSVAAGHYVAHRSTPLSAIAQTQEEELAS